VAVRAEVSRATAWRALRTTKGIDASTAERIADAVEAMASEVEKKFRA
jgi:DNA-binding LacI/PurR family transcriptional regulator